MDSNEKKYGFAEPFQRLIVAAALQDSNFLTLYGDVLKPTYFDYDYLSSILRIVKELAERNSALPTRAVVVEELKAFFEKFSIAKAEADVMMRRLDELYAIEVSDIAYIQERILKFGRRQALRGAILESVQLINGEDQSDESYETVRSKIDDALIAGYGMRNLGLSVYKNLSELPKMAARSSGGVTRKIPTGIETFDKTTHGGPGRGELYAIVGDSGRGKSSLLVTIGAHAAKNGFVVFHYTVGDLDETDVGLRYAACLTRTDTIDIIRGTESYMKKAAMLSRYNLNLHVKEFPSGEATVGHIRAHAMRLCFIEGIRPDVIIIDYPEELAQAGDNMYINGGDTYTQCRKLGKAFDAVTYVASQPKPGWQTGAPHEVIRGRHMNESSKKFHKLDGLLSWNMTPEEEMQGRGRLWVDKQRRNKSFYLIHFKTDMSKMLMYETKAPPESPIESKPRRRRVSE